MLKAVRSPDFMPAIIKWRDSASRHWLNLFIHIEDVWVLMPTKNRRNLLFFMNYESLRW